MSDTIIATKNTWRYYEGLTSSKTFIRDIAKVLSTGVKTDKSYNPDGSVFRDREIIIQNNWDIVYPTIINSSLPNVRDWNNLTPQEYSDKINKQLSQIKNTVILKMTTETNNFTRTSEDDDITNEPNITNGHIYVELYKPNYLADSEKYSLDCEKYGIQPYNATKEIYHDALSTLSTKTVNFLDSLIIPEVKDIVTIKPWSLLDQGDNSYPDDLNVAIARKCLITINTVMNRTLIFPEDGDSPIEFTLSNSDLIKIRGTELEPILTKSLNLPLEVISIFNNIKVTLSYKETFQSIEYEYVKVPSHVSGGWRYPDVMGKSSYDVYSKLAVYSFECHDIYSVYSIPKDFTCSLPEKENAFEDSIKITVGNSAPRVLGKDFSYNRDTFDVTLITPIEGQIRLIGEPVLSYKCKKTNNDIVASTVINNNNYALIRMFDNIKDDKSGPLENPNNGVINSHISEWSKLSWYQDFEEVLAASLNSNLNVNDITDGTINVPIEIKGLTEETKFQYRINTNRNRAILSVTGNTALDFRKNRNLNGIAYIGQVESFENSINDTIGNFALFASSSSIPCSTKTTSTLSQNPIEDNQTVGIGPGLNFSCSLKSDKVFDLTKDYKVKVVNTDASETIFKGEDLKVLSTSVDNSSVSITLAYEIKDKASVIFYYYYKSKKITTVNGVSRDGFGNVVNIIYPDTFGIYTANGMTDISMFTTKNQLFFQKHYMMFATTEEFMSKSMYGKSAYTDEYYADRIKVIHPVDGPRGMLFDCLAIDSHSLLPFDELVVNKEFKKDRLKPEETYIYIPVTAAFSPFCSSPNATFGFAIKTLERYSRPLNDEEKVDSGIRNLSLQMPSLLSLTKDIILPSVMENGITITWESSNPELIEISEVIS